MASDNQQGRVFFFAIFALLAILTFIVIEPFLGAILLALITVVLLRPLYVWLGKRRRIGGRTSVTTTLTILIFLLAIIVPIVLFGILFYNQLVDFLDDVTSLDVQTALTDLVQAIEDALQQIPPLSDIEIDEEAVVQFLQGVGQAILSWLSNLAIGLVASLPASLDIRARLIFLCRYIFPPRAGLGANRRAVARIRFCETIRPR